MNIDEHPAIPGQMGIQSIPAVIAFVNGQPADGFMGALPEGQVSALHRAADQGQGRRRGPRTCSSRGRSGARRGRRRRRRRDLCGDPGRGHRPTSPALAGLARAYVATGEIEQAKQTLDAGAGGQAQRRRGRRRARRARGRRAGQLGRPGRRARAEGRGQSARPSGALRSRGRAQRRRQAPGGGRPSDGDRQARPQMERGRRAQAARAVLRGLGPDRRGDRRRPQASCRRSCSRNAVRRAWRRAGGASRCR